MEENQFKNTKIPPRPVPPPRPMPNIKRPVPPVVEKREQTQENLLEQAQVNITEINEATEKNERVEVEKQPKKKLGKKSLFIVFGALLAVVIIAVSVFMLIGYIKDGEKIATPEGISVHVLNTKIYVEVEENDRAEKYTFHITKGSQSITINSPDNAIDITSYISKAGEYEIKAKYKGKREKADSNFCESYVYKNYVTLDAPKIAYDEDTKTLSWVPVENATGYILHYGLEEENVSFIDDNNNISVILDNNNFFYGKDAGLYVFSVEAVGSGYYLSSELSNKVTVENGTQLRAVQITSYDALTSKLTFTTNLETSVYSITLFFNNGETAVSFLVNESIKREIVVNLQPYITSNSVERIEVVAVGDGSYLYNSPVASYTVN